MAEESRTEGYLRDECKKIGWLCLKFSSPGTTGVPDRLLLGPGGLTKFVETKRRSGRLRPRQKAIRTQLAERGHRVHVITTQAQVDGFIGWLKSEAGR